MNPRRPRSTGTLPAEIQEQPSKEAVWVMEFEPALLEKKTLKCFDLPNGQLTDRISQAPRYSIR
jgi:hypothetical protein